MNKTVFECQNCGYTSAKWLGRCPDCNGWNSFAEEKRFRLREVPSPLHGNTGGDAGAIRLEEVSTEEAPRMDTRNPELNRALGGGMVPGSLILLGGEPGVGKSTLLLQLAHSLRDEGLRVLYASGEESAQQIKLRAGRIWNGSESGKPAAGENRKTSDSGARAFHPQVFEEYGPGVRIAGKTGDIYLLSESNLGRIMEAIDEVRPGALVIDSVQTVFSETLDSAPGSVSQVRHAAMQLLTLAKTRNLPVFLIGHVTKDGSIAGPKALEHIVDVVLYFEGEGRRNHRIIRAVKNRYGAAGEVGIFEMTTRGLLPAENPSRLFLMEREDLAAGSAVVCAIEGTRPILVEIQALVLATQYGAGRRVATGVNYNRISVLTAMLEKRLGIHMTGSDIYVNTAGGLEIDEPGADLGIFAAILGSLRNRPLEPHTVLLGELSLSGAVRPVTQAYPRVREAAAMGFRRCVLPAGNLPLTDAVEGIEFVPVKNIAEASDVLFG
ncbi:MAG: DNA repair protein RadA [Acidobacteriota bacterium]|jgi:DNA repair protein RadA/Sms|nr:DNA repair protein RadA [Acidobacteriota bacterium]